MAYYARLNHLNKVTSVIQVSDEIDFHGDTVLTIKYGKVHKRTSYNTRGGIHYDPNTGQPSADQSKAFRKNYAGIGYSYDSELDAFIPPQPYPSWTLDEQSCLWNAPVAMPSDGKMYSWDEDSKSWAEVAAA